MIVLCNTALPNDLPVMPETCRSVHILKHYCYLNQVCAFVHLNHNIWIIMHRIENVKFIKCSSFNYNLVNCKTAQYSSHDSGWHKHVGLLTWCFRCGRLWGTVCVWLVKCDTTCYNAVSDTQWKTWLGRGWQCSRIPTSACVVHSASLLGYFI
jgi:hypothetical protein